MRETFRRFEILMTRFWTFYQHLWDVRW